MTECYSVIENQRRNIIPSYLLNKLVYKNKYYILYILLFDFQAKAKLKTNY